MATRHHPVWAWVSVVILAATATVAGETRWKVMPIRSQEQYDLGMIGGEGEQHPQGMARSVSHPDVIYVSHDVGQVWRSDDSGRSWKRAACRGMYAKCGQSIEVDPVHANVVYAIIDSPWSTIQATQEGLYRSTDWGESWDLVLQTSGAHQRFHQHNIAYDPSSIAAGGALRWYAAFPDNGVYRSDDGGLTWSFQTLLTGHTDLYAIGAHIADGTSVYMGTDQGLFLALSGVITAIPWGDLPAGAVSCVEMHPTDPDTFYVVVKNVGLYRTVDGGFTFTSMYQWANALRVHVNPTYPDVMFLIGSSGAMQVSRNSGVTWASSSATPPLGLNRPWKTGIRGDFSAVMPDPRDPDVAIAYAIAMIWSSNDGGLNWTDSSAGFTGYNWSVWNDGIAYDVADPNRFVIFIADAGMLITENGGDWFERRSIPSSWRGDILPWSGMHAGAIYPQTGSDTIVMSCGYYVDCGLLRTTNAGDNLILLDNVLHNYRTIEWNTDNPSIVYAGDKRSTDAGVTFTPIPGLQADAASIVGMCLAQPDTVYAVSDNRRKILRSDDAGVTWNVYTQPGWTLSDTKWALAFAVDPVNPDLIYTRDNQHDVASYNGTTWTSLPAVPDDGDPPYDKAVAHLTVDPRHPEVLYVSLDAHGVPQVFRSTDTGQTWEPISANLPLLGGITISVHPLTGDVFVGTACGTYVYPPPYLSANLIYDRLPDYFTPGDFDYNGYVDADDVDLLAAAIRAGSDEMRFNLYRDDDIIDNADMDELIYNVFDTVYGDSDLDGDVDLDDFTALKTSFGMLVGAGVADGDFDGDGDVDLDDFAVLKINFGS